MNRVWGIVVFTAVLCSCGSKQSAEVGATAETPKKTVVPEPPQTTDQVRKGPFGVEMGMSIREIKALIKTPVQYEDNGILGFNTAPKPYPGFENYIFFVGKSTGLCKVSADSEVKSNSFGNQVDERVDQLTAVLKQKYGEPSTSMNSPIAGSIWNEPNDYMMGLLKKERIVAHIWGGKEVKLPDGLQSILVEAEGVSAEAANVTVSYEFTNFDRCVEERKASSNEAL